MKEEKNTVVLKQETILRHICWHLSRGEAPVSGKAAENIICGGESGG